MQNKKRSLLESLFNIGIGYIISISTQLVLFPLIGIETSFKQNLLIGVFFTLISIIRSYFVRRLFNRLDN
jgi:predicted membrane protein